MTAGTRELMDAGREDRQTFLRAIEANRRRRQRLTAWARVVTWFVAALLAVAVAALIGV